MNYEQVIQLYSPPEDKNSDLNLPTGRLLIMKFRKENWNIWNKYTWTKSFSYVQHVIFSLSSFNVIIFTILLEVYIYM